MEELKMLSKQIKEWICVAKKKSDECNDRRSRLAHLWEKGVDEGGGEMSGRIKDP